MSNTSYLFCKQCNRRSVHKPTAECWDYSECAACFFNRQAKHRIIFKEKIITASLSFGVVNEYLNHGMLHEIREIQKYDE